MSGPFLRPERPAAMTGGAVGLLEVAAKSSRPFAHQPAFLLLVEAVAVIAVIAVIAMESRFVWRRRGARHTAATQGIAVMLVDAVTSRRASTHTLTLLLKNSDYLVRQSGNVGGSFFNTMVQHALLRLPVEVVAELDSPMPGKSTNTMHADRGIG